MEKNIIIRETEVGSASVYQFKHGGWAFMAEGKYCRRCFRNCFNDPNPESEERYHIFTTPIGEVIPIIELKDKFNILDPAQAFELVTCAYVVGEANICTSTRLVLKYGDAWYTLSENTTSLKFLGNRVAYGVFYDKTAEKLEMLDYAVFHKPMSIRTIGDEEIEFDDESGKHHHYRLDPRGWGWYPVRPWWKRILGI